MSQTFNRYISTIFRASKLIHYTGSKTFTVCKIRYAQESPLSAPANSPVEASGFSWGQDNAGALLLSFSLLREVTAKKLAIAAYKAFCTEVVTRLKTTWTITAQDIKYWLKVWQEEQNYLQQLEAAKPKSAAPRSLPFYGVMEEALGATAYKRIKEFVHLAPVKCSSSNAMLYLELAANLLEARRKTIGSIYWGNANAQARTEVWLQLLMLEQQIGFNLERFGQWWDVYIEQVPPDFSFPIPDYLTSQTAELVHHQQHRQMDLRNSIKYLSDVAQQIRERGDRYEPFLRKQLAAQKPF